MRVNSDSQEPVLVAATLPLPHPANGEVLIQVRASGVTPTELIWYPTTHTKEGGERRGAVPGHEFSGIVAELGNGVVGLAVGDEVYGMNDWFAEGSTAEFCLALPQDIARKPESLTHEAAATVPIGALTAWQGLFDRGRVRAGDRVLIHGASGAVGIFAVQLARRHGARVIATASKGKRAFVEQLGAEQVIDYNTSRFEDEAGEVDVVFDGVGGETLDRSWAVLKPGGRMVTIAAQSEGATDQRTKDAFFIVEPNQAQLVDIGRLLDSGALRTFVGAVVPLAEAATAYGGSQRAMGYGKVVVAV